MEITVATWRCVRLSALSRRFQLWMRHLKCSICDKHFSTLHGLELHQDLHRGRYPYHCQFCGKGCLSTTNLRRHLVKHTGVRDHKCTLCAKEFSCPWTLRRHINTHKDGWVIDASVMDCLISLQHLSGGHALLFTIVCCTHSTRCQLLGRHLAASDIIAAYVAKIIVHVYVHVHNYATKDNTYHHWSAIILQWNLSGIKRLVC